MRRLFTLPYLLFFLFSLGITISGGARKFYMAPTGNDNNNGSITAPFKTLLKVWTVIAAGDTVYLRGGTYEFNTSQYLQGRNGTAGNLIKIWNYPGEKPNLTRSPTYNASQQQDLIYFEGNYFHWKGLEISWFDQKPGDYAWPAFRAGFTSGSIFEQIDYHHNGAGMSIRGNSTNNLFLNCDFHHNQDPYSSSPYDGADGIDIHYIPAGSTNTLRNCRAWWNADDGFDCWDNNGYMLIENCWSFYNGYIPGTFNTAGNGSGIKLGSTGNYPNTLLRTVQNCVAFKNRSYGIVENAAICKSNIFNNVVSQSGDYGFWFGSWGTNVATLRNNIGWNNPQNARLSVHDIHDHNSWNGGVTVNASDFISLDDSQLLAPRQADGSLPASSFFYLLAGSDLVNAGVNVGLPYNGTAPDIAAIESGGATPPPNQPPVANAGPDHNILIPVSLITATGSGTDPDGTIAAYQWTKVSGPTSFLIVSPIQAVTVISGLVQGIYEFELRVTDNNGGTDTDTMSVTVGPIVPPNQPPVANAGPNQTITLPLNSVTLTGTGTDPDGTITAYEWRKFAGPSQFNIVSPNQAQTVVNNLVQGTYRFELKVTDNDGATDLDTIRIIVNAGPANQSPTANAGPDHNITLPVNTVTATGSGSDPDGTISNYQWTKIAGPAQFTIVSPTQAQTVINNMVQGVYQFELEVTDNLGGTDTDTMTVTVNAAPNQLPSANAGADHNITLPVNTVTATGSGSDPDGTIASYQWTKISGPTQFLIVSPAQAQTVINNLVQGVYQFQLRVTDNQGAQDTDTMTVTVNAAVPPPNQAPSANAGADHFITLPVNSVSALGSATDPDGTISSYQWTKIAGPAQYAILFPTQAQTVINNLAQGVYQFELRVTDNQGAVDTDTMSVTVNPAGTPPNQAPSSNAGADHNITLPTNTVTALGSGSDPDGTITAYQWTKISGPAQYAILFPAQAQTVINNLVQGVYQFELRVTDNQGGTDTDTMTVTVNPPPNQPPVANAGTDKNITLPTNSITQTGSATDPDGTIVSYQWTRVSGPAQYVIISPLLPQTVINNLVQGVYQFELRVTDNQGATDTDTMTVTVNAAPPPNQAPSANAGADHNITLPTNTITALGSGSDPDGTITAYQWTKIAGPAQYAILFPAQAQTVINNLVQGVYQFELRVTDNQGAVDTDTMIVTVNPATPPPPNQAPSANAGNDIVITLPVNTVTALGSGSDPDGTITAYQWTKIAGPAQYAILFPAQAQTVINNLVQGVYQFELRVTDNQGAIDRDTMIVTVNPAGTPPPNQAPSANAGNDIVITLPVNTVNALGSGTDPDGTITAYQWTKIAGPAQYNILFPAQAQTVINNLVQGVYQFELRVTDNQGAIDRDTMIVTVNPAGTPPPNQAPTANAGNDQFITLPVNTVTALGSATDPDGTISTYQWTKIAGPAQYTILFPAQAQTVINNLVQGVYQFELRVTDNQGAVDTDTMSVTVNPAGTPPNQAPSANAGPDHNITLPTNTVIVLGSASDPDGTITVHQWTKISGPAQYTILFTAQPQTVINNLVQGVYQFELRVTDNQGAVDTDTMTVTVNAAAPPPNQPPVANASADTSITLPVNNVVIAGSGSDPGGSIVAYQWTKISGPSQYTIVSPAQAQTEFADLVEGIYQFELLVTDNQGATDRDTVQVTVNQNTSRTSTARIYPNPATTIININIEAVTYANKTSIQILNVMGVTVYQTEVMRTQQAMVIPVDVSRFPNGSYFVKIGLDLNNTTTLPFIKQ